MLLKIDNALVIIKTYLHCKKNIWKLYVLSLNSRHYSVADTAFWIRFFKVTNYYTNLGIKKILYLNSLSYKVTILFV